MIDEKTYQRQLQAKQGKRKIRRKGTDDDFTLAMGTHIGGGRFMFTFLDGPHRGQIIWEEQVEIKKR